MGEFFAALVVFGLVITGMAVGVIFSDRRITGSCGGLGNGNCVCKNPCEKRQARMQAEQAQHESQHEAQENEAKPLVFHRR